MIVILFGGDNERIDQGRFQILSVVFTS